MQDIWLLCHWFTADGCREVQEEVCSGLPSKNLQPSWGGHDGYPRTRSVSVPGAKGGALCTQVHV